ncbi:MAG: protein kinase [Labilithrix sp.]|nr:protein kinase [Labilithrix sp.]MCW5810992.1 protein kinase [Labilithrix sp.]
MLESTPMLVGDVIAGKYRIDSVAGEGGMGIVYEAEHVILRQRVAVKAMLPGLLSSADALDRFSREASAIARITCEHVVRVTDAGTLPNGAPYLVMEYLDGSDLADVLSRRGPLPPSEVVDYALQALEGLAHVHAARVVHRDLKSANLFLARLHDGRRVVKLLDFGIALAPDLLSSDDRAIVGSPSYMSPEQLRRDALDTRTDLWSIGVVMYELLAGEVPFTGSLSQVIAKILEKRPVLLNEQRPAVPPALAEVVARCLERDPDARWPSTLELARALAPHGTGQWREAVGRIERALANVTPRREPRRFETLDTALQALDDDAARPRCATTQPPASDAAETERIGAAFGPTMPIAMPTVPAAPLDARPGVPAPAIAPALALAREAEWTLRILMIDDSTFVLGVYSQILVKAGFDVRTTTSVREFDDLLARWQPHLVLMDVQMPEVSGDELCRRVKARFKATVPVVFVSDLPRAQLADRAAAAQADAFLSKTSDWNGFVDFVRNICAITYSPEHLP